MFKNLINGEWLDGHAVSRNINPSDTRDLVGEYAQADAAQAELAISAASAAFPAWSLSTPQQRFDILDAVGTENRQAVAGNHHVGAQAGHLSERHGPVAQVTLHLLWVAGVRDGVDEKVPGVQQSQLGDPRPGGVVGLSPSVVQLER